ncbi:hypothetical protein QFZ63_003102 [Streptomyces sp. B3I7]|nr:hypothetical protein [Streptomyces sp. B3I7]
MVGGSEFAAHRAMHVSESENEQVGVVCGLGQDVGRGAVDDLSVHGDAAFEGRLVRECRTEEGVGCR